MLTGAARAARTAGVLHLEHVWVVAVPVVVLVVIERLVTLYFLQWTIGAFGWTHPWAELVGRAGPITLRTALVATCVAVTGYAFLWAMVAVVDYVRSVKQQGRRVLLRGGVFGRLVVFGSMLVMLAYETTVVTSLPTAEDIMVGAKADFSAKWGLEFPAAVIYDVPGIREFCREKLDGPSRPQQILSAFALMRLGDDSDRVCALLRSITREEFLDPTLECVFNRIDQISFEQPGIVFFPGGRSGISAEEQEKRWQEFRRNHIP